MVWKKIKKRENYVENFRMRPSVLLGHRSRMRWKSISLPTRNSRVLFLSII